MSSIYENMVTEFHQAFGHPVGNVDINNPDVLILRAELIQEEAVELFEAIQNFLDDDSLDNLLNLMKELGDLQYVLSGFAVTFGLPLDKIVEEIHRSNMTKLDEFGKPIYRADGKVLKGPLYEPPDLEQFVVLDEVVLDA